MWDGFTFRLTGGTEIAYDGGRRAFMENVFRLSSRGYGELKVVYGERFWE